MEINDKDMDSKQYVVALEISSSKIVGVVGEPNANGGVDVLDIEAERSLNCVRYGCIQNVEETKVRINRVISRLESRISPKKISGVYVGVSGRSLRNYAKSISTTFDEESMITENVIESLKRRYYSEAEVQGGDILEVIPCRYFVDNNEIANPIGAYGTNVMVQFNGIVAKTMLKMNIERALLPQYSIKGYIVTPIAMAEYVLTNEERQLGCMLVDFGAEITTVAIYRSGVLQYLATLPMGSQLITRDLMCLNMLEDAAEEIKKTLGNAIASDSGRSMLVDGVQSADVQNYVVARCEEIVTNINEQISYSGIHREQIAAGVVLVGGGSLLNGFGHLVGRMTKLKVRLGSLPSSVQLHDKAAQGLEYLQINSVLALAASMIKIGDSCVQDPVVAVKENPVIPTDEKKESENSGNDAEEKPIDLPSGYKSKKKDTASKGDGGDYEDGEDVTPVRKTSSLRDMYQHLKYKVTQIFEESEDAYYDTDDSDNGKSRK